MSLRDGNVELQLKKAKIAGRIDEETFRILSRTVTEVKNLRAEANEKETEIWKAISRR